MLLIIKKIILGVIILLFSTGASSVSDQINTKAPENEGQTPEKTVSTEDTSEKISTTTIHETPSETEINVTHETENNTVLEEPVVEVVKPIEEPAIEILNLHPSVPKELLNIILNILPTSEEIQKSNESIAIKEAVVNILCLTPHDSVVDSTTGSGVIIDPRGVILTNAHVAQNFILKDYPTENNVNCMIRRGNPARSFYTANLLYLSPVWVTNNLENLKQEIPTGTGENDFALLLIDKPIKSTIPLPEVFPYIPIDIDNTSTMTGESVTLIAYPAGNSDGTYILNNLASVTNIGKITEIYTLTPTQNNRDLLVIKNNSIAQRGSSGGAVIDNNNNRLTGIIVTSSNAGDEVRSITTWHINQSFLKNSGSAISSFLGSGGLKLKSDQFNKVVIPGLLQQLITTLSN
jgi:hypothetical protein